MSDSAAVVGPEQRGPVKSKRGRMILGLILTVLIILLLAAAFFLVRLIAPSGERAVNDDDLKGITWVRSIYGISSAPEEQFFNVQAAVPGDNGSVWVVDGNMWALAEFTADGRYVKSVRGPEDEPLLGFGRFDIGPDGRFYICDIASDAIRVLDSEGKEAGSFGVPRPTSIAIGKERIAVGTVQGVAILDMEGKPLQVIGSRGKGEDQFDYVHGVAIDDEDNVYAVDSYNNRIRAYDKDGKELWAVLGGQPGNTADMVEGMLRPTENPDGALAGAEALQLPLGATIDGAGRLVVVDMFESSLVVFDTKDGSFIAKYGDIGAEDGQFFYPVSVDYDSRHDWFTVADQMNDRVQIVRIPGSSNGDVAQAVRRGLAGPLRACLLPLLLLLVAIVVAVVRRLLRKRTRHAATEATPQPATADSDV